MTDSNEGTLQEYFKELDHHFIGMTKASNENYFYKSADTLVQTTWELPVVVQWPDSFVRYEFSSQPGDIWFGIIFVPASSTENEFSSHLDVESVEELQRVNSGTETVKGTFELKSDGVIFFLWDNTFDWSATKKISYNIEVIEPSFTLPDQIRTEDSLPVMREIADSLNNNLNRLADATDSLEHNLANVKFLEDQITKLTERLNGKKQEANALHQQLQNLEECIERPKKLSISLYLRTLDKALTKRVLEYVKSDINVYLVCTYWTYLLKEKKSFTRKVRSPRISGTDRIKMLASIQRNKMNRSHDDETNQNILLSKSQSVATSEEEVTLQQISVGGSHTEKPVLPTLAVASKDTISDDSSSVSSLEKDEKKPLSPQSPPPPRAPQLQVLSKSVSQDHPAPTTENKVKTLGKFEKPRRIGPDGKQHRASFKVPATAQKKAERAPHVDSKLLENVQKIRSEQQMNAVMEYLHVGFAKIDKLSLEKRKIKKLIKAWNATYEKQFGRIPSSSERKGHLRELYEDYHKVALALKIKRQKLTDLMHKVGITEQSFQEMRTKLNVNW